MLVTCGYYIITPSNLLKNRLAVLDLEPDLKEFISQAKLWERDRVNPVESEGDIDEVKLLFLANIKSVYLGKNQYEKIFDSHQISLDVFDKWWQIKRYFIEEHFAEVEEEIESDIVMDFVKTGRERVDLWIDSLQKKHNSD